MPLSPVKAQEVEEQELVDPQTTLREKCREEPKCAAFKEKWDACETRVRSRKKTAETCSEELIDFIQCVDHCVAPELFKHLK
ncbi:cytochrome b-c1 complex subunit 6, mitochondrial [Galendromus occidentalis]|uniref:Cytochrome b-c1 complex subunit 6 n=1 Tax=Galendromus occidentalis TaxID=34638 RepID=A0AAJ6QXF5_9ACAR|nr:cytochrome b-c1 complex subunit 6, mitochondrial [Galendromus occidentalis]